MEQSKTASAVEAIVNIIIGCGVAYASQVVVFPIVGIHNVSHGTHLQITLYFTLISFARSYVIRRFFATRINKLAWAVARARGE